jgi:hypothetical protein
VGSDGFKAYQQLLVVVAQGHHTKLLTAAPDEMLLIRERVLALHEAHNVVPLILKKAEEADAGAKLKRERDSKQRDRGHLLGHPAYANRSGARTGA